MAITLVVLCIAGITLGFVGDGALMWIGIGLFVAAVLALVILSKVRGRSIERARWQDGTVTFRTVEPGNVGESGQRVDCEVELSPLQSFTRVYKKVGPLDAERIAVEVDDAFRQRESLAREAERVGGIELLRFGRTHSLGRVTPCWRIYLPARSA